MNNYIRTVRRVFRYKWTLTLSMLCTLAVAVLWGANIGGIYPVIQVVFNRQSLQDKVREDITKAEGAILKFNNEIASLENELPKLKEHEKELAESKIAALEQRLKSEQSFLEWRQWAKPYVEEYMPSDPWQTLFVVMMALLIGTILKNVLMVFDSILIERLTSLVMVDVRKRFFRRTLRLDLAQFNEGKTNDLLARFTSDMGALQGGVQTILGRAVREPLRMIACLIGAGLICWRLLLISMIFAPLLGYAIGRLSKSLKRANKRAMEEISQYYGILGEVFSAIKVVKGFARERNERQRFHRNSKEIFKRSKKIAKYDALVHPLSEMAGISAICLSILAGAYLVLNEQTHLFGIRISDRPLTMEALMVFYGFLIGVTDPARKLTDVFNQLQRAAAASDRIYQYLDREPKIKDPRRPVNLHRHCRDMSFENIRFGYLPDQTILHNINLTIKAGEVIAIVGPNGCGKSTLLNLIPRFYEPEKGRVKIDGIDIRDARLRDLRNQLSLVTQEAILFNDTVYNNIRYSAPQATREQIIEAAKKAHAHEFIERDLEHGYETTIGTLGGRLSGGQRQRIALARAILRDPTILLLDEATSQIDPESEAEIHNALEEFTKGRTTIMITHRLSTLELADRIVVMDRGTIVDAGTHKELFARCEDYRRLQQVHLKSAA